MEWHAYDYGWRAMMGLSPNSPIDPQGHWRDDELVRIAHKWYCKKHNRKVELPYNPGQKPAEDIVRPNWRQLYPRDMTQAERGLSDEARDELMRRLRSESPRAAAIVDRVLTAPEIQPKA